MMPGEEQQGPNPNDAEQVEKKENADQQQSTESPDALRKQVAAERNRNDKLEKTIAAEGGENNEQLKGPDRLEQLIRRELQVTMQQQLGLNEDTNFEARDTDQLRSDHALLDQSRQYVTSHTAESLASTGAMEKELKTAFDKYKSENPDDATGGGLQGADKNAAANILRNALLKTVNEADKKVVAVLKTRGVDAAGEQKNREDNGEQLRAVRGSPNDNALSANSKNSMRDFRNQINSAKTPDGITYNQLVFQQPKTEAERNAAKKFNTLADKFNDALAYCVESGAVPAISATDKNVRAALLKDYGADLTKDPVTTPENSPKFKDWLTQHADKVKTAREQATKGTQ